MLVLVAVFGNVLVLVKKPKKRAIVFVRSVDISMTTAKRI